MISQNFSKTLHLLLFSLLLIISAPPSAYARDPQLAETLERHRKSGRLSDNVIQQLDKAGRAEVLVSLDEAPAQELAARERRLRGLDRDDHEILRKKAVLHRERKRRLLSTLALEEHEVLEDYEYFGVLYLKASDTTLARLLENFGVVGVHENRRHELFLSESLPLIGQPAVAGRQHTGAGQTIAILDSGVNYSLPVFGSCIAPNVPPSCKVVESVDVGPDDNQLDNVGHGTVVAEIASRVAPDATIFSVDIVDSNGGIPDSQIIGGLNKVLAKSSDYHFAVVNLSLGRDSFSTVCDEGVTEKALFDAINAVRSAGIPVVAASGNSAFTGALAAPACFSTVISVGATYDASFSTNLIYSPPCEDSSPSVDSVACFSNISNFLSILAPGAKIYTTADTSINHKYASGTSFAAPHVAGAIAVIAAAQPTLTPDEIVTRLIETGTPVTVTRNTVTYQKPRLNLDAALIPRITASPLSVSFGTVPVDSVTLATEIVVNNSGTAALNIQNVSLGGGDQGFFSLVNDTCSNIQILPGAICTVGVIFQPQVVKDYSAVVAIPSNAPATPTLEISLSAHAADLFPPIRLVHLGTFTYVESLAIGYSHAVSGDSLQLQSSGEVSAGSALNRDSLDIAISGGFDGIYSFQDGVTTIIGPLAIGGGKVTVQNVSVR